LRLRRELLFRSNFVLSVNVFAFFGVALSMFGQNASSEILCNIAEFVRITAQL